MITEAGHHPAVEHLVYLTAFALDEGETLVAAAPDADVAATDLAAALVIDGASVTVKPDLVVSGFYHDCDAGDAEHAESQLRANDMACFTTPVGRPAWKDKPATYVVCTEDRAIHPELQRVMAARCATAVDFPTAHSPFLNRPDLVADLLTGLAKR